MIMNKIRGHNGGSGEALYRELTKICVKIASGDYQGANRLFELTSRSQKLNEEIRALAEAFGLMLVKVEAREFHLRQLVDQLKEAKEALEAAKERLARDNVGLRQSVKGRFSPKEVIGNSRVMESVIDQIRRVADLPVNVLITGETGTGKELVAKTLHYNSARCHEPFIAINCTSIPENLFESELFGIEKGVATGVGKRIGRIEQADKGTLFLDEIGDMPQASQAKILRVLEERSVCRVGGRREIPVDMRVLAATNKDLKEEIRAKRFREDLYFRLKVVEIKLPPLRQRRSDIPLLAEKMLQDTCRRFGRDPLRFSPQALESLVAYNWPGNVRELQNEVERAAVLSPGDEIRVEDLSEEITAQSPVSMPITDPEAGEIALPDSLEELERGHLVRILAKCNGNKSEAARRLGISREGLRKKLARYGMR